VVVFDEKHAACVRFFLPCETAAALSQAAAGWRAERICGAEKHRLRGRARSAHRELTWSRLVERSERSKRSEFRDWPRNRASQGSRRI